MTQHQGKRETREQLIAIHRKSEKVCAELAKKYLADKEYGGASDYCQKASHHKFVVAALSGSRT